MSELEGVQADVMEQAYRYGDVLSVGAAGPTMVRFDHTVMLMCDSAVPKVRWYHLVTKHGQRRKRRCRCPLCGRMATLEVVNGRG